MALSVEHSTRIEMIRVKMARGEATREEEMEAFSILRRDREGAQLASTKARTEKAAATRPVDTKSLLANITAQVFNKSSGNNPPPPQAEGTFKL